MKKWIFLLALLPLMLPADVTIVENKKARAEITWDSANDDSKKVTIFPSSCEKTAVRLAEYIQKSTGAVLPVKNKSAAAVQIRLQIAAPGKMDPEAFSITFPNKNTIVITAGSSRGLEYACAEFLERFVGVRWLFPGPLGTEIPKKATIKVPEKEIVSSPSFLRRFLGGGSHRHKVPAVYYRWMVENKGSFHERYNCFHNLLHILPVKKYGKSNPEFYPIINGKRFIPQEGIWWQPCMTAPGIVEAALEQIPANAKSVSLAVNDGGKHCECERCLKLDKGKNYLNLPNRSVSYLAFCSKVAQQRPNTLFGVSAYADVAEAPENIKLPKNIVPEITYDTIQRTDPKRAEMTANILSRWKKITQGPIGWYDYVYGQGYALPRVYTRHLAKQLKWLYDNNVRYLSGEYYPNGDWQDAIKVYVWLKLAWDITLDPEALIDDWCRAAVGKKAAPSLKAYFDRLEKFWTSPEVRETNWFQSGWTYLNWSNSTFLDAMPLAMIDECEKLLVKTVELADNRARAEYFLKSFRTLKPRLLAYKKNQELREKGKKLSFDRVLFEGTVDKSTAGFSKWQESAKRGKMLWSKDGGVNNSGALCVDLTHAQRLSLCWLKGLAADPGRIYKVTVRAKAEGVDSGASVSARTSYQKNNRWMDSSYSTSEKFVATEKQGDWHTFEIYTRAPEQTGTTLILLMSVSGSNRGKVFFDDIKIETANYTAEERSAWEKVNFGKAAVDYHFNVPRTMWMKAGKAIVRDEKNGRNNTPCLVVGPDASVYNIFPLPGEGKRKIKVSGWYKGGSLKLSVKWMSPKPAWLPEKFTASAVFPASADWKEFVLYTTTPEEAKVRIVPFAAPGKKGEKISFDDFKVQMEEVK